MACFCCIVIAPFRFLIGLRRGVEGLPDRKGTICPFIALFF